MTKNIADLALNEDFDVFVDSRGDIGTVSGRGAFEQEVLLRISKKYMDIAGEYDRGTIADMLQLDAERVAKEMELLDTIADISIVFPKDKVNTIETTILYDSGKKLVFTEQA